jgi:hypothetical protein
LRNRGFGIQEVLIRYAGNAQEWLVAVLVGIVGLGFAAGTLPAQTAQQAAAAPPQKAWKPGEIHTGNTRIYVHVFKTGMGHEHAVIGLVREGFLHLGAEQNAGYVVADLTSLVADPEVARRALGLPGATDGETQKKVNSNMKGPEVLDVARFPVATAKIHSARLMPQASPRGMPQYLLEGEFNLHGVTRKMSVAAEADESNGWIRLRGHTSLLQSNFGIPPYTALMGAIGVADQVELYAEAYLVKEGDLPAPVGGPRP